MEYDLITKLGNCIDNVYNNYMTVDFYDSWQTMMKTREQTLKMPKQMQSVVNMRAHLNSVALWRAVSVRPNQ